MATAFNSKIVILGALFIFAYQGAEVSISGWVISFLIATRHGNPSAVGYVTSGFWGGVTVGRFLLSHPAHKIGEKLFVYCIVAGAAGFQLLVWLVPNIIGDAVAVAIVGLLLGPVYPCATTIFSRLIARKDQVSSLSVISAFGSSGGAVAPFTTGILAQVAGTFVLHPIAIGLFAVMLICWFILPTPRKRTE
jgi:fucose permease